VRYKIPYFCGACAGAPQNAYFCGEDSVEHHPCAIECIFWCATEEVFPTSVGFLTERKLAAIFIKPSLGVPNWPVISFINSVASTMHVKTFALHIYMT
jgi:hypothetical protein